MSAVRPSTTGGQQRPTSSSTPCSTGPPTQSGGGAGGPETGDGFLAYLEELAGAIDGWARPGLRAIAAFAQLDRDFADRFRHRFLAARHGALIEAIAASTPDWRPERIALTAELVAGSLWFRVLVADEPLDDPWVEQMAALVEGDDEPPPPKSPM